MRKTKALPSFHFKLSRIPHFSPPLTFNTSILILVKCIIYFYDLYAYTKQGHRKFQEEAKQARSPKGRQRKVFTYVNNTQALNTLGEEGLGIIPAPKEAVTFFKLNLVPILPEVKGPAITINFFHLKSLGEFPLINDLYTYLVERLR